ncbi:MAG: ATP-binding cassette, subfamily bacterial RamB/AmfA [Solirubrobacteraceae bacterium]|jgi:ATP-binding cassette subfamily C protein|nr:ATP-binding cassette, subfamily bacterial RamB/AmfA [Solirubrobacteraceae bacterium]
MTAPALTTRRLLGSALRGRGSELRLLVLWSTIQAIPAFLSGRLVAQALDDGFLAGRTGRGFVWLGLLGVSAVVGAWATRETFLRLARIVEPFRDELARLAVTSALRHSTEAGAAGDTAGVARLTQQVEVVRDAYASILLVGQNFVVVTGGALLGLLTLMPEMLALVLPPLVVGLAIFLAALGHMAVRQRESILAEERIAERTAALTADIRDIVACGAEDIAAPMVGQHIEAQARAARALARLTAVRIVAVAVGGLLPVVLILLAGPWLVAHGATAGMIFGALTYVLLGMQPALQTFIDAISGPGLWLVVTLRRIAETSDPVTNAQDTGRVWQWPPHHGIQLRGVTFAYGPFAEPVIDDLNLAVPHGEHLAIVGPSGVGKSTLANVVAGVLQPQSGDVRLGGLAVCELDPMMLAQHRVLIPQEAYVFGGSLYENLTYLHQDARPAEIDNAVHQLGMQALVDRLGGYDAELDPTTLSAGERQLITLVRAYVSPAWLIILDEASCHLDPAAEATVEEAFARRPGTFIVIAHRISSAIRADRILVLDGTQVLHGTHHELLQQSALYRDLVGHWQFSGMRAA